MQHNQQIEREKRSNDDRATDPRECRAHRSTLDARPNCTDRRKWFDSCCCTEIFFELVLNNRTWFWANFSQILNPLWPCRIKKKCEKTFLASENRDLVKPFSRQGDTLKNSEWLSLPKRALRWNKPLLLFYKKIYNRNLRNNNRFDQFLFL